MLPIEPPHACTFVSFVWALTIILQKLNDKKTFVGGEVGLEHKCYGMRGLRPTHVKIPMWTWSKI